MIGLLLKDLLNLKQNLKTQLIMLAIFAVSFLMQGNGSYSFPFACIIILSMSYVTSFGFDEQVNWNRYALSLPVSRKDIVLSKYLLLLLSSLCGAIISSIVIIIASFFLSDISITAGLLSSLGGIIYSLFSNSVLMPLLYKYGVEKARVMLFAVLIIPSSLLFLIIYVIKKFNFTINPTKGLLITLAILFLVFVIAEVIVSIKISISVFSKKEF